MGENKRHREEEISLDTHDDTEPPQTCVDDPEKGSQPLDVNHYAMKKSAAQSMLDVALLMANSSQLKTLLHLGPRYTFYMPLLILLSLSILLQVAVGLLLVFIVKYDMRDVRKHGKLNRMNNFATIFVFFTVLINIFITALGFHGEISGVTTTPMSASQSRSFQSVSPASSGRRKKT